MDATIKQRIIEALQAYAADNGVNAAQLKELTGVSKSYLEVMLAGGMVSGKTQIGDTHFGKVADAIGYRYERQYWKHVDTDQYQDMLLELMDSKAKGSEKIIIGETRSGKTYTIRMFKKMYPAQTYCITVSSLHNLNDILDDISLQMGLERKGNKVSKLRKIAAKLRELKMKGKKPILVVDEAENLTLPALRMTKALYDVLADYCPILLVGTPQLQNKLEKLKDDDGDGIPQLYYRFTAGLRMLKGIDKESMFEPFLELVEDEGLKVLLSSISDNYGVLNRYLEPALREASELGEPLTEKFFRQFHKL